MTTDWTDDEPAVPLPPGPGLSGPGAPYPGVVDEQTGPADRPVAFVTARLDEREAAAKAAGGDRWVAVDLAFIDDSNGRRVLRDEYMAPGVQAHIALNDPAYVLDDIAAKRKIIAEHAPVKQRGPWREDKQAYETEIVCPTCIFTGDDEDAGGNLHRYREHAEAPCETLCLLAAPFCAHPDYDPAWAVSR